ncbi:MAG TPA: hypothetical protein VGK27_06405 [Candidatus Deferrimicrobiaceae bacterium]
MVLRISGGRFGFFLVDLTASIPAERGNCGLFMQLRADEEEYIVLSTRDATHSAVVERFCGRMELPFETVYGKGCCSHGVGKPGWVIVGGGEWRRDPEGRWVELRGTAPDFGMFDPDGLQENLRAIPGWAHVDVRLA